MAAKALIFIADGTEEMEAVIVIDMLRRAGIEILVAGENENSVCSRSVKIASDILIRDMNLDEEFDALILPGGLDGVENLYKNEIVLSALEKFSKENKLIAAICAAPTILARRGMIVDNMKITSHPSVSDKLGFCDYLEDGVVSDGNFITSRGAGTAFDFSLKIIERLAGKETAEKIAKAIVLK